MNFEGRVAVVTGHTRLHIVASGQTARIDALRTAAKKATVGASNGRGP